MGIVFEKRRDIAYFTMENGTVNPITPVMHRELYEAMVEFLADDQLKVGILSGAGERAFSAGDDIKTVPTEQTEPVAGLIADRSPAHRLPGAEESFDWSEDLMKMERYKPVVGAVNGWCLGQGLIYLLALTDVRVAAESARFGFPEIAYGMGGAGGMAQFGRQVPHTAAMAMLLTGDPIDAAEAKRIDLVNEVVPDSELIKKAEAWAARIARHPALALRIEMEAYRRGMDSTRLEALRIATDLYAMQRLAIGGDETVDEFFRPESGSERGGNDE